MIPAGMVAVPGGRFRMGSDEHYPEERPKRPAGVAPFLMDRTPVTTAAFAAFVAATGFVTLAERVPDGAGLPEAARVPGSAAFRPPPPGSRPGEAGWWAFVPGACWRDGVADHPVVHVAWEDAAAFAAWAGKALPTEAEWEFAAKGGGDTEFAWGREFTPDGRHQANTWQGRFPFEDRAEDGYAGTSPVGAFPANPFGLVDMIGNVWEWTADLWSGGAGACCAPGAAPAARRVIKGGSHLCAPNYCQRYRPAARQGQEVDSPTSHLGFRCVKRQAPAA